MPQVREINHKSDDMIDVSRSPRNDSSRYSGPDPQLLPFPPELVVRILAFVDKACDKKNARLVCKGFAAAGLSSLTSKVHFSTSLIGIAYSSEKDPLFSSPTLEIAMHPVVSKYITAMVCEGTQLSTNLLTYEAFRNWWLTLCKPPSVWPIEMHYNNYASRYFQEELIISRGEDQKIFCRALENFPKLDCVWFRDIKTNGPQDWPRPTWPLELPKGDLWGPSSPYQNFAMCIRVLSERKIKLRELHITGREYAISLGLFTTASPADYIHLLNVFENLRKVNLNVNTHRETCALNYAGLGRILTHATNLQSLDLKCHSGLVFQSRLVLSRLFRDFTWQHLKHIGLSGFRLYSTVDLIAFFHRHRATIVSVTFNFMFLHQSNVNSTIGNPCQAWKHFFNELRKRSIKFRNLRLHQIHDCCNSEGDERKLDKLVGYGVRVLRYLHEGGTDPFEDVSVSPHSE